MNRGKKWTVEEEMKLLDSFQSGLNHEQIAKIHQRSELSIKFRLITMTLNQLKEGKQLQEVFKMTGVTQNDIDNFIKRREELKKIREENKKKKYIESKKYLKINLDKITEIKKLQILDILNKD